MSIHFAADQKTIETSFRMIVSANQLRSQHNAQALAAVPRHQITEDLGMRNSSWCSGGSVRHDGRTFAAFVECTTHSPFVVLDIRIVGSSSGHSPPWTFSSWEGSQLQKARGGVRGIVVGVIVRRFGSRTVAQQLGPEVERATAPFQYAV